jgi:hypothetical protein
VNNSSECNDKSRFKFTNDNGETPRGLKITVDQPHSRSPSPNFECSSPTKVKVDSKKDKIGRFAANRHKVKTVIIYETVED